ncbi:MAG: hypothetical protein M9965_01400 [Anaerolineae bacterium]|nr:hypothetical protein [Anaerolineae bacterium]
MNRLQEAPEPVYQYLARRFGVGHNSASFTCEIDDKGHSIVSRRLEVEAFSEIETLDSFLMFPEGNEDREDSSLDFVQLSTLDKDWRIIEPEEGDTPLIKTKSIRPESQGLLIEIDFTTTLRFGDYVRYLLIEKSTIPVFELGHTQKQNERPINYEYFGWAISRPTRQLQLKVIFPLIEEPIIFRKEVRRSTTSGFKSPPIQHAELLYIPEPTYEKTRDGRIELSLSIMYPVMGLTYMIKWQPRSVT